MKKNKFRSTLKQTREYLDYVERHYNNVQRAYKELERSLKGTADSLVDPVLISVLDANVRDHDLSKLSKEEFVQYRQFFYPFDGEEKNKEWFLEAWDNHQKENEHHWQNWTKKYNGPTISSQAAILENIIDWMAMGYEFGNTAVDYYENNKEKIDIPDWAVSYLERILGHLDKNNIEIPNFHKKLLDEISASDTPQDYFFKSVVTLLPEKEFNEWVQMCFIQSPYNTYDGCFEYAHKMLRQTDVFYNADLDLLLYNYICVAPRFHRVLKTIIDDKKFNLEDYF